MSFPNVKNTSANCYFAKKFSLEKCLMYGFTKLIAVLKIKLGIRPD